jgi:hypothetical protein
MILAIFVPLLLIVGIIVGVSLGSTSKVKVSNYLAPSYSYKAPPRNP